MMRTTHSQTELCKLNRMGDVVKHHMVHSDATKHHLRCRESKASWPSVRLGTICPTNIPDLLKHSGGCPWVREETFIILQKIFAVMLPSGVTSQTAWKSQEDNTLALKLNALTTSKTWKHNLGPQIL